MTPYPGVDLPMVFEILERGERMLQPEGCPDPIYDLMHECKCNHCSNSIQHTVILYRLITYFENKLLILRNLKVNCSRIDN